MTIATAIHRFRSKQALQFSDAVTVVRPSGEPEFDPDTEEFSQATFPVYTGPCKIRPVAIRGEDQADAGETLIATPDSEGKFPVDTDLERDDIVTVTASTYDASMVGKSFRVKRVPVDAWQIARVAVLEQTLPPLLNGVS